MSKENVNFKKSAEYFRRAKSELVNHDNGSIAKTLRYMGERHFFCPKCGFEIENYECACGNVWSRELVKE